MLIFFFCISCCCRPIPLSLALDFFPAPMVFGTPRHSKAWSSTHMLLLKTSNSVYVVYCSDSFSSVSFLNAVLVSYLLLASVLSASSAFVGLWVGISAHSNGHTASPG